MNKTANTNIITMPARTKTTHFTDMQACLAYHCEMSHSIPRQYHSELSEYIMAYWSVEYLMHRLSKNALELQRGEHIYDVFFVDTDLVKLIALAQTDPKSQVVISFRRAKPCYDIQSAVLIKPVPGVRPHGY